MQSWELLLHGRVIPTEADNGNNLLGGYNERHHGTNSGSQIGLMLTRLEPYIRKLKDTDI